MIILNKLMTSSRTTEVDASSIRIIGAYNAQKISEDAHLDNMFANLKTQSDRLTSAIKSSMVQSELDEKDEERDTQIRAIYYIILGALHHPDPAIQQAAGAVNKAFEKYGLSIISKSYDSQTSLIKSMLEDFAAPELKPSIDALSGLQQVITALHTAQNAFEQTRTKYDEERAEQGNKDNATTIKKEVVKIINDQLVIYLRAMVMVNEAQYGNLTRTIATIINDNNEVVRKRRKQESNTTE